MTCRSFAIIIGVAAMCAFFAFGFRQPVETRNIRAFAAHQ